jgi:hypothetical protein
MGQQQLLLIVLGVIIVGIAVVVGINLFTANAVSSNRDGVVSDLNYIGANAMQYYRRPTAIGGGGYTFTNWTLPTEIDTTPNGTYSATVTAQSITVVGTGNEKNAGTAIKHTATITSTAITIVKNN